MEFDELLISIVQENSIIWDNTQKDFRDKEKRDVAWNNAAAFIKKPAGDCMTRWRSLRERYARELKKLNLQSGSGTDDLESKWPHMQRMAFLQPFVKPRSVGLTSKQQSPESSQPQLSYQVTLHSTPIADTQLASSTCASMFTMADDTDDQSSIHIPTHFTQDEVEDTQQMKHECSPKPNDVNVFYQEISSTRDAMARMSSLIQQNINSRPTQNPAPERKRVHVLFELITDRYMALSNDLQDEFDIAALSLLRDLSKRNSAV